MMMVMTMIIIVIIMMIIIIIIIMVMMIIMMMIIVIKIIIIALKGAVLEFYNFTAPRTISSTYTQVSRTQSCANHVRERLSRATCVPRGTKGQFFY